MKTQLCPLCNKEISVSNFQRHLQACDPNYQIEGTFACRHCGRISKTSYGNTNHERRCKQNPNRVTRIGWARGLTKATNQSIAQSAETYSKNHKAGLHKNYVNPTTRADVRAKISKTMCGNHNNDPSKTGRGRKGWYKGFFCSSRYELAFVIYCLDFNIPIKKFSGFYNYTYEGKEHRYYPDFIINDTVIEIKGFWTAQVDAKTAAVTDRNIKVLYAKDLAEVFTYIKNNYNKSVDKDLDDLYEV